MRRGIGGEVNSHICVRRSRDIYHPDQIISPKSAAIERIYVPALTVAERVNFG